MNTTSPLKPYQRQAARFALTHPYCGLFLDMGLGKTLTTIAVMDLCRRHGDQLKWLVVMPPALVRQHTWEDELDKWSTLHHLTHQTLGIPPKQRLQACQGAQPDVTFISNASLKWLDDNVAEWPWNAMIIDELSAYRNTNSQRFRILRRHRKPMRRIIGLTGTPVPKSLENLWGEIYLLDGGQALGRSISRYRSRWFTPGQRNWQTGVVYDWQPRVGAFDEIMDAINPFCLSMSRHDKRPDLKDAVLDVIPTPMPPNTLKTYLRLQKDQTVDLDPGVVTAVNAGALTNRFSQVTAGFLYPDRSQLTHSVPLNPAGQPRDPGIVVRDGELRDMPRIVDYRILHYPPNLPAGDADPQLVSVAAHLTDGTLVRLPEDSYDVTIAPGTLTIRPDRWVTDLMATDLDTVKLDALTSLVTRLAGEPLLVFYRYRRELTRMQTRFGTRLHTLDEPDAQHDWNQGRIPILALQPASSQYGLNLQYGGHHICWTSPTWDLEQWAQANARLNRSGQTHRVTVHVLAAPDSVDMRILDVLAERTTLQDAVMRTLTDNLPLHLC